MTDGVRSPCRFSDPIIPLAIELFRSAGSALEAPGAMLDPYAGNGVGKAVGDALGAVWVGSEIEPEFARFDPEAAKQIVVMDSRDWPTLLAGFHVPHDDPGNVVPKIVEAGGFALYFTSPDYGNRMADQLIATKAEVAAGKVRRRSYASSLGRKCSPGSGAALQWGPKYRELHAAVQKATFAVMKPGAYGIVNVSDHYRTFALQGVPQWWMGLLERVGWTIVGTRTVETRRYKDGENSDLRAPAEILILIHKKKEQP
jgi:hypothetical protein